MSQPPQQTSATASQEQAQRTACTAPMAGADVLDFNAAPLIRCDVAPWTLWGISLAGFNFLISSVSGAAIVALAAYRK